MRIKWVMRVVGTATGIALGFLTELAALPSQPNDDLQKWIAAHATPVRSIDPADKDFNDLEPLIDAIGGAQVVQLGEISHGAGNSFLAKARLIKFLHQRMGFDVLVWESGMHGMRLARASMRSGDDAVLAGQRGVFPIWSGTEEVRPLLEYVKQSQSGTRPIEMAGFDIQFTASKAFDAFAAELHSFVGALRDTALRTRALELADQVLDAYKNLSRPNAEEFERFRSTAERLLTIIDDNRTQFGYVHGSQETSFMRRATENLLIDGTNKMQVDRESGTRTNAGFRDMESYFNRRDGQNAQNLRWLIEEVYRGRKVIVWAHNVHISHASFAPKFSAVHLKPQTNDMKPTGAYLKEWLGDKVYTIGLTAYGGSDGWITSPEATPVQPVARDSLESRLHSLSKPYLFLDLRRPGALPKHPLRTPQTVRILVPVPGTETHTLGYGNYKIDDITRVFDAIFYIDQTTPVTRISGRAMSK